MIDAKRAFRKVMREWGHDIYLQRMLANGNHSNKFERVTTRQVGQSGMLNADSTQEMPEGIVSNYDAVYYFEDYISPKEGDRIYENYSLKVNKNYTVFRIDTVSAIRGRLGVINYWVAGATREK